MIKLKLLSWNVNGIRAVMQKDFLKSIEEINPDIFCLQETKARPEQVEHEIEKLGYKYEFWNSAEKKGYSGTAIFSKIKPINVIYDMDLGENFDNEGRVITLEFDNFFLTTVYTPNSKRDLSRLVYREDWDNKFLEFVKKLEEEKPVIFCGDLNVAHREIDLKNPSTNKTTKTKPGNAGFTDTEREGFDKIVDSGFIDTFRFFHPETEQYTWWSYMFGAREKNVGWRIDYFLVSKMLEKKLISAKIHDKIIGSDHCPVEVEIEIK